MSMCDVEVLESLSMSATTAEWLNTRWVYAEHTKAT